MENTPYLYDTLLRVLGQHSKWLDRRHRQTLAWMMMGLISSKTVSLGEWAPYVVSRARYAQSIVRRFSRWLDNNRIKPEPLYGPLIEQALVGWVGKRVYVALDTSMLWNTFYVAAVVKPHFAYFFSLHPCILWAQYPLVQAVWWLWLTHSSALPMSCHPCKGRHGPYHLTCFHG